MREAGFYEKIEGGDVHCYLCAQHCRIAPGERGTCGVRENREGTLFSLVYGRLIAKNVDPIEKKPLYHFMPGSLSYSVATMGCNLSCAFCQNADISQTPRERGAVFGEETAAAAVAGDALGHRCASISYTYTEPTVFLEYALDAGAEAKMAGLANVFVSNGFMTEESAGAAAGFLDAANIDLKAFQDDFYRKRCGARLKPVLRTIGALKAAGVWVEVTTLLIPGENDDPGELRDLAQYLAALDPDMPWHVSRFHPAYRMADIPPTPVATVRRAREIGLEAGLRYVYTGNVPGDDGEHTLCRGCGATLLQRHGFSVKNRGLSGGACTRCGAALPGVGLP